MAFRIRNTFTRTKEEFKSIEPGKVRMYTCGPTVYNYATIGNFRAYMFEDLLRRFLKYKGYAVTQVMNLTDIDDKTIRDSQAEGVSLKEFTDRYIKVFFEDLDTLGIERAEEYPAATDHIPEMVKIIKKLKENGLAYEIDGNWYFKISGFKDYGKLANLDMSGLKAGARVAADEYEKDSVSDFALWKAWDEADGDVFWETELGKGRPGWHIECSAMAMKYLGQTFDLHCGGIDNMFPHHENEIAQSEGATGVKFVNYWMHNEYLIVDGRRMSKSAGNFYTLRDLLDKGHSGLAVRYLLMATHYRQQLNFTFQGLEAAGKALERYNDFISHLENYSGGDSDGTAGAAMEKAASGFEKALDDDLNISGALGVVFDYIRDINRAVADGGLSADERDAALQLIRKFDTVLNFRKKREGENAEIDQLVAEREQARKNKDFARADEIRDQLKKAKIILKDSATGTIWQHEI